MSKTVAATFTRQGPTFLLMSISVSPPKQYPNEVISTLLDDRASWNSFPTNMALDYFLSVNSFDPVIPTKFSD